MYAGKLVFAQVMEYAPWHTFRRLVAKYHGDFNVRSFSCLDQFLCMAFAQLTYRESLRDIEACLGAQPAKLYHLGIRGNVSRSALADANEGRDWRIYFEFAQALIRIARRLYAKEPLGVELSETVYALDSTTIDLCLSLFPWAPFRQAKAAVKLHTLLDLRGAIPTFIHISDGKLHDVNVLDLLVAEPGAFYVMDRGYLDFERLYTLHQAGSLFVTRAKSNSKFRRLVSRPVDRSTWLICDQSVELTAFYSHQGYPERLRRIRFKDPETAKTLVFLTNHFALPAHSPLVSWCSVAGVNQPQAVFCHRSSPSAIVSVSRATRALHRSRASEPARPGSPPPRHPPPAVRPDRAIPERVPPPPHTVVRYSGEDDRQPTITSGTWRCFHNYLYIASKADETVHQTALGKTAEPTAQQVGKFGLRHPQQFRSLGLGEPFAFDDLGNLGHELGFDQHLVGIAVTQIGIHVAGAYLHLHALRFAFAHFDSSFTICSAAFNRSLISSIKKWNA